MPDPAAMAQALQCGTPGKGSGRRNRQRPGSTRSPRPSSPLRATARTILSRVDCGGPMPTTQIARRYFEALNAHDLDAAVACWTPGGVDRFVGQQELTAPDGVREYFRSLFDAFPDMSLEVLDVTTSKTRAAVRWRGRGTFAGPGTFQGFTPNGARIEIEGCDVLRV